VRGGVEGRRERRFWGVGDDRWAPPGGGGVAQPPAQGARKGSGGERLGRHWAQSGGTRGRAGPWRRRPTTRRGRGEGEAGRAEGRGWVVPGNRPKREGGLFYLFYLFPIDHFL
jgi:hypothetical protein